MKNNTNTLLDKAASENQTEINKNFLKEWKEFDKQNRQVKNSIFKFFTTHVRTFNPSHDPKGSRLFKVYSFSQIDNILGLAYTSSSDYAALWICNSGHLYATDTHYFIGFAINTDGQVIGIAHDEIENEYFVKM